MQGALDARPVVLAEVADPVHDVGDVLAAHRLRGQLDAALGEARLRRPAEIEHDLDQRLAIRPGLDRLADGLRHHPEQQLEVVHDLSSGHGTSGGPGDSIRRPGRGSNRPAALAALARALSHPL